MTDLLHEVTPLAVGSAAPETIRVNELYGPVFQGEGPRAGRPALFLRLAGCNLACSWCDTPYSWDWKRYDPEAEVHSLPIGEVADAITASLGETPEAGLVVTGGEPMIQQHALFALLGAMVDPLPLWIGVETNGTRKPTPGIRHLVDDWMVSVKLSNSGDSPERRIKEDVLRHFAGLDGVYLKPVVQHPDELWEVEPLADLLDRDPWEVWIMPEGETAEDVLRHARLLEPHVLKRGWCMTLRQQVFLHPGERAK